MGYSLSLLANLWLMIALIFQSAKRHPALSPIYTSEGVLALFAGATLGTRVGAILSSENYDLWLTAVLTLNLTEILTHILSSPPSGQGALIGAVVGVGLWSLWKKQPFWLFADLFASPVLFSTAFLWIIVCRYGLLHISGLPEIGLFGTLDSNTTLSTQIAIQALGGTYYALTALILTLLRKKRSFPSGVIALLALWVANLFWLLFGFYRYDPTFFLGPFRLDQLLALGWVIITGFLLPYRWSNKSEVILKKGQKQHK